MTAIIGLVGTQTISKVLRPLLYDILVKNIFSTHTLEENEHAWADLLYRHDRALPAKTALCTALHSRVYNP